MVRNKSVDRDLYSNNVLFSNSYQNQSDFFSNSILHTESLGIGSNNMIIETL